MSDRETDRPGPAFVPTSLPTAMAAPLLDPILRAAAELFDRHGYEKVRMEDVAARAHISKNTLYRRFSQKTALLGALVEAFAREFALHLSGLTELRHEQDVRQLCDGVRRGGAESLDDDGIDPSLVLAGFLSFCHQSPALTRVALAARDPLWSRCDRRSAAALFAAVRHALHARNCSDIYIDQILGLFLFIGRELARPRPARPLTAWAEGTGERDPYGPRSPIGSLLRMLVLAAWRDSDIRP